MSKTLSHKKVAERKVAFSTSGCLLEARWAVGSALHFPPNEMKAHIPYYVPAISLIDSAPPFFPFHFTN